MANFGIKIMRFGKSITSTNPDDYFLWSKYNTLKKHSSSGFETKTISAGTAYTTWNRNHGLGFTPISRVYFQDLNGRFNLLPGRSNDSKETRGIYINLTSAFIQGRIGTNGTNYDANANLDIGYTIFTDNLLL